MRLFRILMAMAGMCAAVPGCTPVWIDTDPAVTRGSHEVDDGFALVQAFHSPEICIRGVSVVFGNAPLEEAFPIGREIVRNFGPHGLHIYKGAASAADLGRETAASRALAAALKKEPLTILALGPATNVATVVKNHADLQGRILAVIAVAGRRPDQHFSTGSGTRLFRDFNFEMDADAFAVLLASHVPLVMAPWEISSKVWLDAADLERFKHANSAGGYLYGPATDWLAMWKKAFGVDGFNPFDTLAVAFVTSRALLHCDELGAEIRTLGSDTGPGDKPYLLVSGPGQRRVTYCHTPDAAFKADLMQRLIGKGAGGS